MGWIRTCRLSAFAVAVTGMVILFARGPVGAQERKEAKPPKNPGPRQATAPVLPAAAQPGTRFTVAEPVGLEDTVLVRAALARTRFNFKIDPKTPLKDLLPVPPQPPTSGGPLLEDDLTRVPELMFQKPLARNLPPQKALEQTAHAIAKINHLNQKKTDAFMEALLASRADLSGLAFAMGDSCRSKQERSRHFQQALKTLRQAMGPQGSTLVTASFTRFEQFTLSQATSPPQPIRVKKSPPPATTPAPNNTATAAAAPRSVPSLPAPSIAATPVAVPQPALSFMPPDQKGSRDTAEKFWARYRAACLTEDNANLKFDRSHREQVTLARIAALMQVLAPESATMRKGLVSYLATLSHAEATRALAKLAIFSKEREVREAACDALKVRRERDYTEILLSGLRYPWPAVAKHATEAIVKLERKDLIPQLVAVLDNPDPRLPRTKNVGGKSVLTVRELVRINHHRNCLMCHAPAQNSTANRTMKIATKAVDGKVITSEVLTQIVSTSAVPPDVPTAQVPIPGEPFPTPSQGGYDNSNPDILVRLDVTYLRQDFSEMQSVANAHPWPEKQRFDFLVRTRMLSEQEADSYRAKLSTREPGQVTPYQRVALAALRDLTGRDTEPTAAGWRRLLNLEL